MEHFMSIQNILSTNGFLVERDNETGIFFVRDNTRFITVQGISLDNALDNLELKYLRLSCGLK